MKYIAIPKMELVARTLSVTISVMLQKEFQLPITREFKMFVANRVEIIHENSCDSEWFHVNTKANPPDYCSRGIL